mgnify:CR=1 FL=1
MKIAIIGGGASAVCCLDQIVEQSIAESKQSALTEITVFERGNKLGRGLAYDTENILNMRNDTMFVRPHEPSAFTAFALKAGVPAQNYAERRFFGSYLDHHLQAVLTKAHEQGIKVNLCAQSEVTDLDKKADLFTLTLNGHNEYTCDKVLLCPGNQSPVYGSKLNGTPGYFHKSYDIEDIANSIPQDQDIVLLGSGLASIDAFLSLQKRGHKGKITFVSRTGMLPKVRAACEPYELKYLSSENLAGITKNGSQKLSFSEMASLFLKEFSAVGISRKEMEKEILRMKQSPASEALRESLVQAESGSQQYFNVLKAIDGVAGTIWNAMSEEAQAHFDKYYKRLWDVFDYPMPPENAQKILSALENGGLEVLKGFKDISYDAALNTFSLDMGGSGGNSDQLSAKYVINTTGQGFDLSKIDNALLRNLYDKGILRAHPRGGIDVDYETGLALASDKKPRNDLYIVGSLTRGVHFYTNSLTENAKAAARAAKDLVQHLPNMKVTPMFDEVRKHKKIVLFIGSDISSQMLVNKLVPAMQSAGYTPVIYLPRHKPSGKMPPQDLQDLAFYERRMTNEFIYPLMNAQGLLPGAWNFTPEQLATVYNIEVKEIDDINNPAFVAGLINDEFLSGGISIRCYQKFGSEIIGVFEEKGFLWNLHPGILPQYRGVMTLIRAMANGETETSYSLHVIDRKWDAGPLLDIRPQPLRSDKPMLSNYCDLAPSGVPIIIENMDKFFAGCLQTEIPQPPETASYYTFPTPQELADYNGQGLKLVDPEEMAKIYRDLFSSQDHDFNLKLKKCIIESISRWESAKQELSASAEFKQRLQSALDEYTPN